MILLQQQVINYQFIQYNIDIKVNHKKKNVHLIYTIILYLIYKKKATRTNYY